MSDSINDESILEGPGWRLEVDPEGEGERLDRFIARRLPRVSRARAARLEVWRLNAVSGQPTQRLKKSTRLSVGDQLWARRPLPKEDLEGLSEPQVIEETDDFLVLAKPPGWVAHPTASRYLSAITTWLKGQGSSARPAHRLDQETSGVLLCVKDPSIESKVNRLFINHQVEKHYLAITRVVGRGAERLSRGDTQWKERRSLGFDPLSEVGIKMAEGRLEAMTECRLLSHWRDPISHEARCLFSVSPLTGRQHQIRVHLALAGFPLLGDKLYGRDESYFLRYLDGVISVEDMERLGHKRQALHAESLSFVWRGELLEWHCPLAVDLQQLLVNNSSLSTTAPVKPQHD